ncbi:hypothetical protein N7513_007014 [Penicillium frequentans]|nr:hypothetical protein N7513_007014 [Penicillium glabrum]
MPWTQKKTTRELPRYLTIPTGRENWMIMLSAELSYPPELDITSQLRKAWKAIRFRHPGIATELDPSGQNKRYYPIHDEGALGPGLLPHST